MIRVTDRISLDEGEIKEEFIRASGPGGQHVNKTASAVKLRFDVNASANLAQEVKERLIRLAGRRAARGVIIITARSYRSQEDNRKDALKRLCQLIQEAAVAPKRRLKTAPTKSSIRRSKEKKLQRAAKKTLRKPVKGED